MKTHFAMMVLTGVVPILACGCRSPYYADQGAAFGGLAGGLAGAAISDSDPLAGAAIGTAVGALTGATVGSAIDQDVARSRAEIERQMGRRALALAEPNEKSRKAFVFRLFLSAPSSTTVHAPLFTG